MTYDIQAGSPAQVFADAEALADAFVTGSFQVKHPLHLPPWTHDCRSSSLIACSTCMHTCGGTVRTPHAETHIHVRVHQSRRERFKPQCILRPTLACYYQAALRQSGTTGVDAALEATTAASATQASSTTTCQRTFGHWCLDGSRLSRGGLAGIITAGCLVLLALTGAIVFLALRRARNTGSLPGHSEPPH